MTDDTALEKVTEQNFEDKVTNSDLPVLLDFYADWCGPCKMLTPTLKDLSIELQGKVRIYKVDIDKEPETASKHEVRSIPTLILFDKEKVLGKKAGVLPKGTLKEWIIAEISKL